MTITCNGQPRELIEGTTVAALLAELGWEGRPVAVELNFEICPRAQHRQQVLRDGDQLEVVTLVGGG